MTDPSILVVVDDRVGGLAGCLESLQSFREVVVLYRSGLVGMSDLVGSHGSRWIADSGAVEAGVDRALLDRLGLRSPWVLMLDPGDRVSSGLVAELSLLDFAAAQERGFRIRRRFFFGRVPLARGGGLLREAMLVRRDSLGSIGKDGSCGASEFVELEAVIRTELLPCGIGGWLREREAVVESEARRSMAAGGRRSRWLPLRTLVRSLILEGGWRDGVPGLAVALLEAADVFFVGLRIREWAEGGQGEAPWTSLGIGSPSSVDPRSCWQRKVLVGSWTALVLMVLYFSWLPQPELSAQVPMPDALADWVDADGNWNLRTAVPFVLLGGVSGLWLGFRRMSGSAWGVAWLAMLLLACVAEGGQLFMEHRHCDAGDIGWAAAGAAAGLMGARVFVAFGAGLREVRGWLELSR